ncbi:MAG: TetR/AcrR family transcriptional regulator [Eubacteriales bacterium]|nr:TetR/AcrR family transcriptional regulator [Eubacteriales bacterium]
MKREEKSALSRQRILEAAAREFAQKGYDAASLNVICAENDLSKGIIYHYFKDKDELYLLCVTECFEKLTASLESASASEADCIECQLRRYFDARLRFFADHPVYLGLFMTTALYPPAHLAAELARARMPFDRLNISVLTRLLENTPLRSGLTAAAVVEDFRMYMDYFNARFRSALTNAENPQQALRDHEERCHRQLDLLLHGVLEK